MYDSVFRYYDIRGTIGLEFILDEVYPLAQAIVLYLKHKNPSLTHIVVGMDGRLTSPAIKEAVCAAIVDSGLTAVFLGLCPTPAISFALFTRYAGIASAGCMITASHNPAGDNGIKLYLGKQPVYGDQIQEIKSLYHEKKTLKSRIVGLCTCDPIVEEYSDWLARHFAQAIPREDHVILDCGNGATGTVMPLLKDRLGWDNLELLYETVDGSFPNHPADPTIEENMRDVREHLALRSYLFGVGFDGDGDRFGAMTPSGRLVSGDQLLALFARDILSRAPRARIIYDVKVSEGLVDLIKKLGGDGSFSPSGHARVRACMRETGALLAGELSGHFFFADQYFGYDDGIYAFLRLCKILHDSAGSLDNLLQAFPVLFSTPELRIPCRQEDQQRIIKACAHVFARQHPTPEIVTLDGVRITTPYGWGLVRASHTQELISLRFESRTKGGLERIKAEFARILGEYGILLG